MNEQPNIIPINIEDEMRTAYIDYSMSVIVSRALPDVRDGLKPVHRRVLYGMAELGLYHNKPYKKSARIVGEVLGKYHPHGDASVYDTMVRMAQDWSLRYPLVDGQGNFGSIDGDSPAAMRYTEARLKRIAEELLADINKDTVDFQPNFDDSLQEPTVLPAKIPNLLMNGASGIAVGMATNMAPHNLTELVNGILAYIDNPDITIDELVRIIPGPDFPTGGAIYDAQSLKEVYATGKGKKSEIWNFYYENPTNVELNLHFVEVEPLVNTGVPGAIVFIETTGGLKLNNYPLVANNRGWYYYDVPAGTYNMTVKKEGFDDGLFSFTASVPGPLVQEFTLVRSLYNISGIVRDNIGDPVSGAQINATYSGTTYTASVASQTNGTFSFSAGRTNGDWIIIASRL